MNRSGEISGMVDPYAHSYVMRAMRSSQQWRRGDNQVSLKDGKLEDTIAASREPESYYLKARTGR